MTARFLIIWAVPGPWPGSTDPDPDGFADVVRSAMTVERRAADGHVSQEDVRRHMSASATVERIARRRGTPVAAITSAVLDSWPGDSAPPRALAGFHLPVDAGFWLQALASLLDTDSRDTLQRALAGLRTGEYGVVIAPAPEPIGPLLRTRESMATPPYARAVDSNPAAARLLDASPPGWAPFAGSPSRLRAAQRLWGELTTAVSAGEPVQVGAGARHDVLTEALRHAAVTVGGDRGHDLRLLYVDGSEPEPFPLSVPVRRVATGGRSVRVGLMSMRHTELDALIDGYWFRNRLVSVSRTLAETDRFCTATTVGKLRELHRAGIRRIELVHTGFEPAVVGFYRGVLTWLADSGEQIEVQPLYLFGDLVAGTPWGAGRDVSDDS